MPRRPRRDLVVPDAPHHVIVRGNNRRVLFSYSTCYRAFLGFVADASRAHELPVHGLVLMRNHVHLVATPRDASHLATFVKSFAQRYATRRNRARETTGKLFEQRYLAIPIASEAQLAATLCYVELNPVRAGLVQDVGAWSWSTYRLHAALGGAAIEVARIWTPHPWWSALARDADVRGARYRELTAARLAAHDARTEAIARPYSFVVERPDRSRASDRWPGEPSE